MRLGVIGARWPVCAAHGPGLDHHGLVPEWSEDAALVGQPGRARYEPGAIWHRVDLLGDNAVTDGIGLRSGGGLAWLLRHRALFYADQWFAGDAVENVGPTGLGDLREALLRLAVDLRVKQHDRIG